MTRTAKAFFVVFLLLSFIALPSGPARAQASAPPTQPFPQTEEQSPRSHSDPDKILQDVMRRQEKAANQKRQSELQRDADRLLQLATDLKLQVDKSNENILSITVIRKAEEIEKLAHSVKEKMKANR